MYRLLYIVLIAKRPNVEYVQYEDESCYQGEFRHGVREGEGIFFAATDGSVYFGEWMDDAFEGRGTYIYLDGERYEGQLMRGEREGFGRFYYLNGNVYSGEWEDGIKSGKGEQIYANGEKYVG